ncbi:MAG: hypothetical protein ABIA63_03505 [bacterium]
MRFFILMSLALTAFPAVLTTSGAFVLPYRALIVVDDQWTDADNIRISTKNLSLQVNPTKSELLPRTVSGSAALSDLIRWFCAWSVPFDIIPLSRATMTKDNLENQDGTLKYGLVVWDVPGTSGQAGKFDIVKTCMETKNLSLFVMPGNVLSNSTLNDLVQNSLEQQQDVLFNRGRNSNGGRLAWSTSTFSGALNGINPSTSLGRLSAQALQRTLAYLFGVLIFKDYYKYAQTIMDDIGSPFTPDWGDRLAKASGRDLPSSMLAWPSGNKVYNPDSLRAWLLEPLKPFNAIITWYLISGKADAFTGELRTIWENYTHNQGRLHDFEGLKNVVKEGVDAGVFDLQIHGYTHLKPDIMDIAQEDSAQYANGQIGLPGQYWNSKFTGEFHRFYHDGTRIPKEIVDSIHMDRLERAFNAIENDFGYSPSWFNRSGGSWTESPEIYHVLVKTKIGMGQQPPGEGPSWIKDGLFVQNFPMAEIGVQTMQITGHLYQTGPTTNAGARIVQWLANPANNKTWISRGFIAAHSHSEPAVSLKSQEVELAMHYPAHYCGWFKKRESRWEMLVSDWFRDSLKAFNGAELPDTVFEIAVPAGTGTHLLKMNPDMVSFIKYSIPQIKLNLQRSILAQRADLFDIRGRLIKSISFPVTRILNIRTGRDAAGIMGITGIPSGVYLYRIYGKEYPVSGTLVYLE